MGMSKKCVKCSAILNDDDKFCAECGAAQPVEKRCPNCHAIIKDEAVFCPKCGAKIQETSSTFGGEVNGSRSTNGKANRNLRRRDMKNVVIGILLAVIIVGAGSGIYYYKNSQDNAVQTESATDTKAPDTKQNAATSKPVKDELAQANEILQNNGYSYRMIAVSQISDAGFFGLINDGGREFLVYDKKDNVVATMRYQQNLLNLKNDSYVILMLYIKNDRAYKDRNNGYWDEGIHTLPVYALYKRDTGGNVVPGMLYSGAGKKPSHYHNTLKEQQNVNLANLALTSADSLKQDMMSRNIAL